MINAILNGLLSFLSQIIHILLTPINMALQTLVPNLDSAFSLINQFWATCTTYVGFVISYTGFDANVVSIIILLIIANITIPLSVHGVKLLAKWWEVLV